MEERKNRQIRLGRTQGGQGRVLMQTANLACYRCDISLITGGAVKIASLRLR
jgi:hypothetical protein